MLTLDEATLEGVGMAGRQHVVAHHDSPGTRPSCGRCSTRCSTTAAPPAANNGRLAADCR